MTKRQNTKKQKPLRARRTTGKGTDSPTAATVRKSRGRTVSRMWEGVCVLLDIQAAQIALLNNRCATLEGLVLTLQEWRDELLGRVSRAGLK
jgi:hypothetical protein